MLVENMAAIHRNRHERTFAARPRRLAGRRLRLWSLLICVAVSLLAGCGKNPADRLRDLAPDLSPESAGHLASDDAAAFRRWSQEQGSLTLREDRDALIAALAVSLSPKEYTRRARRLWPALEHIAGALQGEYSCPEYTKDLRFWQDLGATEALRLRKLELETALVMADESLAAEEKVALLEAAVATFRTAGYCLGTAYFEDNLASLLIRMNKVEAGRAMFRSALADAEADGCTVTTCRALGSLAQLEFDAPGADLLEYYLNRGLDLAHACRFPDQIARLLVIYSVYHDYHGRFALAARYAREGQAYCREYKGGYWELKPFQISMSYHADFECWELLEASLPRAKALLQEAGSRHPQDLEFRYNELRVQQLEARTLMALGQVDAAEQAFRQGAAVAKGMPFPGDYEYTMLYYTAGLLDQGFPARALPLCQEMIAYAESHDERNWLARFSLLAARAHYDVGDAQACAASLRRFRDLTGEPVHLTPDLWALSYSLRARLLADQGDSTRALDVLAEGIDHYLKYSASGDGGAEVYLNLNRYQPLRWTFHDLFAQDALTGYGFELFWRSLFAGTRAGGGPALTPGADLRRHSRAIARRHLRRLNARSALHCLYQLRGQRILRWTAGLRGLRCDTLAVAESEIKNLVRLASDAMATDPRSREAIIPASLQSHLRQLGDELLPTEIAKGRTPERTGGNRLIAFSAEGFLAQLPLEALDIATGPDYRPLLADFPVVYLRSVVGSSRSSGEVSGNVSRDDSEPPGAGIVMVSPQTAPSLQRRYPSLGELTHSVEEAALVASYLPEVTLLSGAAARRDNLFAHWEETPFLYFATHLVRDPEAPYLTILPLTPSSERSLNAGYLDIADVRSADLRACGLVVLSGCASGKPFVDAVATTPSLADAFLDAGAAAVVQTFWKVRDDEALHLMRHFVRLWAGEGIPPVAALTRARRALMAGPEGIKHPFTWAAFTIQSNGL